MHSPIEALENAAEFGPRRSDAVSPTTRTRRRTLRRDTTASTVGRVGRTDGGRSSRTLLAVTDDRDEKALRILVSFDIDGTMEFGDPPGPVPAAVARELVGRGYIVGVASDWPRSISNRCGSRHGVEPSFVAGKHHLHEVKEQFPADRYVHVGDTEVDERYASSPGSSSPRGAVGDPVVADSNPRRRLGAPG